MVVSRLFRGRLAAEMGPRSCGNLVCILNPSNPGVAPYRRDKVDEKSKSFFPRFPWSPDLGDLGNPGSHRRSPNPSTGLHL